MPLKVCPISFIHFCSPLFPRGTSNVSGPLYSCPLLHPLILPCPALPLFLDVAPPFSSFPPFSSSLLPPSADNVNSPPFTAYVSFLFISLPPPPFTKSSLGCLISAFLPGCQQGACGGAPQLVSTASCPPTAPTG